MAQKLPETDTSKQVGLCPKKEWTLTFKSQIILTYYEIISFLFLKPVKCANLFFLRAHDIHKQKIGKVCTAGHSLATSSQQPQMISIGFQIQCLASSTTLPDTARDKTQ